VRCARRLGLDRQRYVKDRKREELFALVDSRHPVCGISLVPTTVGGLRTVSGRAIAGRLACLFRVLIVSLSLQPCRVRTHRKCSLGGRLLIGLVAHDTRSVSKFAGCRHAHRMVD
jgi:hypothetical protein